jgi:hypothetical protein
VDEVKVDEVEVAAVDVSTDSSVLLEPWAREKDLAMLSELGAI